MPIGGINVFALKVNTVDKGYVNVGPLFLQDWNGYSKQNYGSGENNGDADMQVAYATMVQDSDLIDQPVMRNSAI